MEEYIVLKNDKGIRKVKNYNLQLDKPYIAVKVEELLTISNITKSKKTIPNRKEILSDLRKILENLLANDDLREDYMIQLQNSKNENDVNELLKLIVSDYYKYRDDFRYIDTLKETELDNIKGMDVVRNMFIKKFVTIYFLTIFGRSSREELERYVFDNTIEEVLEDKNIKFNSNSDINGIHKFSIITAEEVVKKLILSRTKSNLCSGSCPIKEFEQCPKVKYKHQNIELYNYIDEGFQIRTEDENGKATEVKRFIVEKCSHCLPKVKQSPKVLKKIKEDFGDTSTFNSYR